jgi:hypothetical protein
MIRGICQPKCSEHFAAGRPILGVGLGRAPATLIGSRGAGLWQSSHIIARHHRLVEESVRQDASKTPERAREGLRAEQLADLDPSPAFFF